MCVSWFFYGRRRPAGWWPDPPARVPVLATVDAVLHDTGRLVREVKVASEPEALLAVLTNPACRFKRIGLEAGPLSQWLALWLKRACR